jgi:hypothetical protein
MVSTYLESAADAIEVLPGQQFFSIFVVYTPFIYDICLPARRTERPIEVVFVVHTIGHLLRV